MDQEDVFVKQCEDMFASFDLDGNGRLTPYVLGQVFKKYGWNIPKFELVVRILIIKFKVPDYQSILYREYKT